MNSFACVYCKKKLLISEQIEDHVIPESLDSPLKIDNVYKKCNNFEIGMAEDPLNFDFIVCDTAVVWCTRYAGEPGIRVIFFTS